MHERANARMDARERRERMFVVNEWWTDDIASSSCGRARRF